MLGDDEIFTHVGCETLFLENGFEGRRYEGERSTQFVRYIGKEFQFELGNLLLDTYAAAQIGDIQKYSRCKQGD